MKTLDLLKAQGKIGLWFSPRTKSLLDQSGNGNVFTANTATGATFINTKLGTYFKNQASAYFSAPNAASNQLNGKGTILVFGEFQRQGGTEVLVAKRGATCNYQLYVDTGLIGVYDGVTGSIATNVIGAKMVGCRLTNAGARVDFFKDGLLLGASSATHTFPSNTEPVSINQFGGAYNRNGIYDLIITQEVLTDEQISDIYNEFLAERGSGDPKTRNYKYFVPDEKLATCKLFYGTQKGADGKIVDLSGNSNNGTITGGVVKNRVEAGDSLMPSDGGYITSASSPGATTSNFSIEWVGTVRDIGSDQILFHPNNTNSYPRVVSLPGGILSYQTRYGMGISAAASTILQEKHYVLTVANAGGGNVTATLYVNGVSAATGTITAGMTDLTVSGMRIFQYTVEVLGNFSLKYCKVFINDVLGEVDIKNRYNQFAKHLLYSAQPEYWLPTLANVTAGQLSNTGFDVVSGSYKVSEDSNKKKWIENVTAGIAALRQDKAYGTYVFEVNKGANVNDLAVSFISADSTGFTAGYRATYTATEELRLIRNVTGANLAYTAASYLATNAVDYKIAISRSTAGVFTLYIKGGAYTNWTLVSVSGGGGTNPVTEAVVTTSQYLNLDLDAGDKFRMLNIHQGVLGIAELSNLYK